MPKTLLHLYQPSGRHRAAGHAGHASCPDLGLGRPCPQRQDAVHLKLGASPIRPAWLETRPSFHGVCPGTPKPCIWKALAQFCHLLYDQKASCLHCQRSVKGPSAFLKNATVGGGGRWLFNVNSALGDSHLMAEEELASRVACPLTLPSATCLLLLDHPPRNTLLCCSAPLWRPCPPLDIPTLHSEDAKGRPKWGLPSGTHQTYWPMGPMQVNAVFKARGMNDRPGPKCPAVGADSTLLLASVCPWAPGLGFQ